MRAPLQILRERWDDNGADTEVKTTYAYLADLSNRLQSTCELAKQLLKAQEMQKVHQCKAGDKCLIFLPTSHNGLLAQWKGPYNVVDKMSDHNYKW